MGSLTLALVKVIRQSFRAQLSDTKYRTMKFAIAVCGVLATSAIAAPSGLSYKREADAALAYFGYPYAYRREASADAAPGTAPWGHGYYGGYHAGYPNGYRREASADAAPVADFGGYGYF